MRDEWGRVETRSWPSDKPLWTCGVLFLGLAVACVGLWLRCQTWTPLQQYWLMTYLSASSMPGFNVSTSKYSLMLVLHRDGASYLPTENEVRQGLTTAPDGRRIPFALTEDAERQGKRLILTPPRPWKNELVKNGLRDTIYRGQSLTDLARWPLLCGLGSLVLGLLGPRRQQIKEHLNQEGFSGAEAAEIAAHRTRDAKIDVSHEEMQRRHQQMADKFGNQPEQVVREAQSRAYQKEPRSEEQTDRTVREAVSYAVEKNFEREAVTDERELMRDAIKRAMGEAPLSRIQQQFNQEIETGGLIQKESRSGIGRSFTTDEMIGLERENIRLMRRTQDQYPPLASSGTRRKIEHEYGYLSSSQHRAVQEVLSGRDQIAALKA